MEKIVILTGPSRGETPLVECLSILFPECETEVQCGPVHRAGGLPMFQEPEVYKGRCEPRTIPF